MGNLTGKVEAELFKGRTHQEIFNEIVSQTDYDIHEIAEGLRKIATPAKRKKYRELNLILIGVMALLFVTGLFDLLFFSKSLITLIPMAWQAFFIYMLYKFKPQIHMVVGGLLIIGLIRESLTLLGSFSIFSLWYVGMICAAAFIAFYIGINMTTDYRLNKEALKENPDLRADAVTFLD